MRNWAVIKQKWVLVSSLPNQTEYFQTSLTKSTGISENHLFFPAHFVILYCLLKLKWNNVENYVSTDIASVALYNPSSRTVMSFITKEIKIQHMESLEDWMRVTLCFLRAFTPAQSGYKCYGILIWQHYRIHFSQCIYTHLSKWLYKAQQGKDQNVYIPSQPAELCSDVTVNTTLLVRKCLKETLH